MCVLQEVEKDKKKEKSKPRKVQVGAGKSFLHLNSFPSRCWPEHD